jgi:LPXTG-site transpeptidase (sortase) family protein
VSVGPSPRRLLALAGLGCLFAGGISIALLVTNAGVQAPDGTAVIEAPLQLPALEASAGDSVGAPDVPEAALPVAIEARLLIPRLGIDAPIVTLGVRSGVMESPAAPDVVGWYSFSAKPGSQGNAVFAGHRDFASSDRAVFGRLGQALTGDEILVEQDGLEHRYRIVRIDSYEAATAPLNEIVGSSNEAYLTLITCTGAFDTSTGRYDQRLVVKAAHISATEQGATR